MPVEGRTGQYDVHVHLVGPDVHSVDQRVSAEPGLGVQGRLEAEHTDTARAVLRGSVDE